MPKFPFTNYHELNLDWILKKVSALFDASEENAQTIRTYETRLTSAEQTATSAGTAATAAQQLADAAAENANSALSVAGTANTKADSALTAATNAASAANNALTIAQEARQIAGNAQSAAADAGAVANDASNAAAAAQQTADTNAGNIATLQTTVDSISGEVSKIDNKADVIIDSASGSIASFADGANNMPIRSLVVNIEPSQSGSGDPSPTNVRPITGREGCTVGVVGVNWLPNNLTFTDGLRDDNGNQTASGVSHYSEPFPIKPNTLYGATGTIWISGTNPRIYFLDINKNWISRTAQFTQQAFTFTTPENCYYIQVQCSNTVDLSLGVITKDSVSSYTPFVGNTSIAVSWQSVAGTVYSGTLDVINGIITVDTVSETFDGSADETWTYENASRRYALTYLQHNFVYTNGFTTPPFTSNIALPIPQEVTYSDITYSAVSSTVTSQRVLRYLFAGITDTLTIEDFKTWLSNNPLQIVYQIAEPIVYQITPMQINTILGYNNIYSDVGSIADVKYPADTKLYIDGKIAELQALVLEN